MLKASPVALLLAAPPARAVTRSPPNKWIARRRLRYASTQVAPSTVPISLAIVGGGLSGLSAAFYYLRALSPEARSLAKVVIFEKEKRVGGWCRSIDITSDKDVAALDRSKGTDAAAKGHASQKLIFETGPRSIRPVGLSGWLTVEMVSNNVKGNRAARTDYAAQGPRDRACVRYHHGRQDRPFGKESIHLRPAQTCQTSFVARHSDVVPFDDTSHPGSHARHIA